jgi:hypothetical protein
VPASGGEFQRTTGPLLTAHVGEVRQSVRRRQLVQFVEGFGLPLASKVRRRLGQMMERHRLDPREGCLRRRRGGAKEPRETLFLRSLGRGQDSRDRPDTTVQGQLADRRVAAQALFGHLSRGREHGQGNR